MRLALVWGLGTGYAHQLLPLPVEFHYVCPTPLHLVGTTLTANTINLTWNFTSAEHCRCQSTPLPPSPQEGSWGALLPVAGATEMPEQLYVLWSHPYTKIYCAFHYTEPPGYENRTPYALVFQEIQLNNLFHLNSEAPSFQDALQSTEGWPRVKSKRNKLFQPCTGYTIKLILSAWLPVPLQWVFPKKSLAPPGGLTPLIPQTFPNLFSST